MSDITSGVVTVITAIIGVAIIAVLVSKQSATPQVLQAGGSAFSSILSTALSPVSGVGGSPLGLNNFTNIASSLGL